MKKNAVLLLLVFLALLRAPALAQTRDTAIFPEGEEETVTETLYESNLGFSFWYEEDLFKVDDTLSECGMSLILYPLADLEETVYLELMLPEAFGENAWETLTEGADPSQYLQEEWTEDGALITGFLHAGEDEELVDIYFAIEDGDRILYAHAVYPDFMEEGFGESFGRLIRSLSLGGGLPVKALWAEDDPELFAACDQHILTRDEPAVWVIFTAREAVKDFRVLSLDLSSAEDGPLFETEEVFFQSSLVPDHPLAVCVTFYGDIPNNGVSFFDANGGERTLALDISGENGDLLLWEF